MRPLNLSATRTFGLLVDGLEPGDARRVDNAPGAFMAVSVDCLQRTGKSALFALAHRFEQNGDLCPDPDVEFLVVEDSGAPAGRLVYPLAVDQVVGYRRHVELNGRLEPTRIDLRRQADLASFCDLWLRNIRQQQKLG